MTLHPKYITDEHGIEEVVLPLSEYEALLDDLEDLTAIAERKDEPTIPWDTLKQKLKADGLLQAC